MKKKILAVVLAGVMAMSMLTACGGSAETAETTETADVETTEDAASDEACSDETFATLQDNYAVMVDAYNQVKDLYESDEIAGDAEIEDLMNQAADVINEMGEISQDTITEVRVPRARLKGYYAAGAVVQLYFTSRPSALTGSV